jgi:hypothetical protein
VIGKLSGLERIATEVSFDYRCHKVHAPAVRGWRCEDLVGEI